jgi:hypothetical protein
LPDKILINQHFRRILQLQVRIFRRDHRFARLALEALLLEQIVLALLLDVLLAFSFHFYAMFFSLAFATCLVFCGRALGFLALDVVEALLFPESVVASFLILGPLARERIRLGLVDLVLRLGLRLRFSHRRRDRLLT